jgi:hypothetical protein
MDHYRIIFYVPNEISVDESMTFEKAMQTVMEHVKAHFSHHQIDDMQASMSFDCDDPDDPQEWFPADIFFRIGPRIVAMIAYNGY